jgi:hypothetical protein
MESAFFKVGGCGLVAYWDVDKEYVGDIALKRLDKKTGI